MKIEEVFITKSSEETEKLARKFAKHLVPGDVLLLAGELGGGKTTFTRGLVASLGFENRVMSPTFAVMRIYGRKIKNQKSNPKSIETVYHLDLYRLQKKEDLQSLDLQEVFTDPMAITVIEWPQLTWDFTIKNRVIEIQFEHLDEEKRKIIITSQ